MGVVVKWCVVVVLLVVVCVVGFIVWLGVW